MFVYIRLLRRWGQIALGRSYWHRRREMGRFFVPGELRGYYADLTNKVSWNGPTDDLGIPLLELKTKNRENRLVYFPTAVLQRALGLWDTWLSSERGDTRYKDEFLVHAKWMCDTQDEQGGWAIWSIIDQPCANPYSAMTQGAALSVLSRAYSVSSDETYIASATRAATLMLREVKDGGTARRSSSGLILEELPHDPSITVLNGWITALFGLYDYTLVNQDSQVKATLESTLQALVHFLPKFDAGYWSYYDTGKMLASPYYHQVHLSQLSALILTFPEYSSGFAATQHRFKVQSLSWVNRGRSVITKLLQELHKPPTAILD